MEYACAGCAPAACHNVGDRPITGNETAENNRQSGTTKNNHKERESDMSDNTPTMTALSDEEQERIASLSYEQARDELIASVRALEAGGLDLEQSMRQWQIGEALAKRAQTLLDEVRGQLDAAQAAQASSAATAGTQGNLA